MLDDYDVAAAVHDAGLDDFRPQRLPAVPPVGSVADLGGQTNATARNLWRRMRKDDLVRFHGHRTLDGAEHD